MGEGGLWAPYYSMTYYINLFGQELGLFPGTLLPEVPITLQFHARKDSIDSAVLAIWSGE
jgi:hypothetical protein